MNWLRITLLKKEGETVNTINSEEITLVMTPDSKVFKKIIFLTHFLFHFSIFKWKKGLIY